LDIIRDEFHGEWNYTFKPRKEGGARLFCDESEAAILKISYESVREICSVYFSVA